MLYWPSPRFCLAVALATTAACSGAGDGQNGVLHGEQGPPGQDGQPGAPGQDGKDGEPGDASLSGVVLQWDCEWCPAPDAGTPEGAASCWEDYACAEGTKCTGEIGMCAPSEEWTTGTAKLDTAFDGLSHTFQLLAALMIVDCAGSDGGYWNEQLPTSCSLSLQPALWTASDQGESYGGRPVDVGEFYVDALTTTGAQQVSCSYGVIDATRFTSAPATCTLTVSEMELKPGGFVRGTFTRTDSVTGPGEQENASSFALAGTFRALIPRAGR